MELGFHHFRNPLLHSSHPYNSRPHPQFRFFIPLSRRRLHRSKCSFLFRAVASSNDDDSVPLWHRISRSLKVGSKKFLFNFTESLKKETGLDTDAKKLMEGVVEAVNKRKEAVDRIRLEVVPAFVNWNRWENWKEPNKWESKRIGALILYCIIIAISCQQVYATIESYAYRQSREKLVEAYMEAVIPEPTPANVKKFKKGLWRKTLPKGLIIKKFTKGPEGTFIRDSSFVGEDAWDDDIETSQGSVCDVIDKDTRLSHEQKEEIKEGLGFSERQEHGTTWQDRMRKWNEILAMDQLNEQIDSRTAKYAVDFDMNELEKCLRNEVEKAANLPNTRALWISKRWWYYRPKLPYMYFLEKLDSSQVAAVVFEENLKRVYVTMKEGFPLEYIVDIPLDPYMFESITSSDAEVDLLQKTELHYLLKLVIAFMPGLIILYLLKELVMLLRITSNRFLYKQYNQLYDMAYSENVFLPDESSEDVTSMYNEVILSGDAWDIVDQIMIFMNNPMRYYQKKVPFIRGILLSGPPGTGKTLFARTLAKESGLPFVFASGAEFADNEISGPARINRLFNVAKRNAPSFIFVDEIDAIAGRHARNDRGRHETLEALLIQLDGGKKETGFDRFSLREAFIFICATNRPEELDPEFVQFGRIDRQLTFSLPDDKQRVRIFGVHSAGKKLAEDVDFEKLAFRTVGYSGADIRNLVNEAAIMSVRKGHSFITQQDLVDVLDKQLLEGMGVLLTEEEQQKCDATVSQETKRLLAVHEAGHVLLAHLFPQFDWHAFSQLLPGGKETAMSVFYPREEIVDQGFITSGYLKMQMVVAHGGRCAEKLVFGDDVTDGGRDDLEKITKIAREMVISPSNSRLGLATLVQRIRVTDRPYTTDGELFSYKWDDPGVVPADMSIEVSEIFIRELTRYIEETEEFAMDGLSRNRHIFDMIVKEFMEKSRITGLELEEKIKQMSPVMFEDFVEPFQVDLDEELPMNPRLSYQPLDVYPAPLHRC